MTAQAQSGLGHSFHRGPWSGYYNQIWLSVSLYLLQMGQWPLCLAVNQPTNHSVSQPASQLASQPASQLSHRIMNDIFTRGRHEESIICTERMLISQPLEQTRREKTLRETETSEKQREKMKDVRAKKGEKKEKEFFKKARPGVEREMKMNERCEGRIECEHSCVLSFRGVSESFLLRCSAFVIKFNPRLSQLQPIDRLYLSPLFFSLCLFCFSSFFL